MFQNSSRKIGIWASSDLQGSEERSKKYNNGPWKTVKSKMSIGVNCIILALPWDKRFEAEIGSISSPWLHFSMCFAIGRQRQLSGSCFCCLLFSSLNLIRNNYESEKWNKNVVYWKILSQICLSVTGITDLIAER